MADGRFLSKSIATDLELSTVSIMADWLFLRCIPHLDREGRIEGHPAVVRGKVCPIRESVSVADVGNALAELQAARLVTWYEVDGRRFLQFPGFDKNQKGLRKDREAASRHPSPQAQGAQDVRWVAPEDSGVSPEDSRLSEVEVEVKGSSDSSLRSESGAGADVENPLKPYRDEAAGIIRKDWWPNGKAPDETPPWTMGRELDIWGKLVKAGYRPEELNGAMQVAPRVLGFQRGGATLRTFWENGQGTPRLSQCIGAWHKRREREPQPIGRILRNMGAA